MSLFRNKYRIASARCPQWDYSSPGYYFVTICTKNREYFLSDVVHDKIVLKPAGIIANEEWLATPKIRPNIEIDEYIIMPNHIHGIIRIKSSPRIVQTPRCGVSSVLSDKSGNPNIQEPPHRDVSTDDKSKNIKNKTPKNWKPGVLGAIIGQFKNTTKRLIRKSALPEFDWQPRFWDHIIRDDRELYAIRRYIHNNPRNWDKDRNVIETQED
jgi:REP element-mobilizing transposase RayT